jgi:hypothetical protein
MTTHPKSDRTRLSSVCYQTRQTIEAYFSSCLRPAPGSGMPASVTTRRPKWGASHPRPVALSGILVPDFSATQQKDLAEYFRQFPRRLTDRFFVQRWEYVLPTDHTCRAGRVIWFPIVSSHNTMTLIAN